MKSNFSVKSIAIKWYFFATSSFTVNNEFFYVYMKQFHFNSKQIGFSNLFGVQHVFIPLVLHIADRYQVRILIMWIASFAAAVSSLLPLLPLTYSLPTCYGTLKSEMDGGKIFLTQ